MKKRLFLVIALSLALCFFGTTAMASKTIKIGGLFDITGGTGSVGTPYAEGVRDYVHYLNDNGGINGMKIELLDVDYQYKIPQALAAYKKFKSAGVVAIMVGVPVTRKPCPPLSPKTTSLICQLPIPSI